MEQDKALIVAEELKVEEVFSVGGLDPILEKIRKQVEGFVPDTETVKGRKEIASLGYKVAKSKTILDGLGKELVSGIKEQAKVIDNERKRMRTYLDDLKEEVRKPLTDWEKAEEKRKQVLVDLIAETKEAGEHSLQSWPNLSVESMTDRLNEIKAIEIDERFEEYEREAVHVHGKAIMQIEEAIALRTKQIEEQAELEKMREEAAKQKEELDRLRAKEQAEQIRKEAEDKAKKEAAEKVKKANELKKKAIQAKKDAAAKAEADKIAAAKQAEIDKELAVLAAKEEAEAKAAQVEMDRLKKEQLEQAKAAKLAANKKHMQRIDREAIASMVDSGFVDQLAQDLFMAIARGEIKHISVNY